MQLYERSVCLEKKGLLYESSVCLEKMQLLYESSVCLEKKCSFTKEISVWRRRAALRKRYLSGEEGLLYERDDCLEKMQLLYESSVCLEKKGLLYESSVCLEKMQLLYESSVCLEKKCCFTKQAPLPKSSSNPPSPFSYPIPQSNSGDFYW